MMQFQFNDHLLWLIALPILVALYVIFLIWSKQKRKQLGDERLINAQWQGFIPGRRTSKFVLLLLALVLLIIGYANPRIPSRTESSNRKGVDVIAALDISRSMMATDISPDRLSRGKLLLQRLMEESKGDRMGLVVFAGRPYMQVPLTVDYGALNLSLDALSTESAPTQGTVLGEAIALSRKSFSQKERKYKALLLISDGETHDERALQEAKQAAEEGVIIYTIGIGKAEGVPLTQPQSGVPILDKEGKPVISKLNEPLLKEIASIGGGKYFALSNPQQLAEALSDELGSMEQKNLGAALFVDYKSYYYYFLVLAFVLLIMELLLPGAKKLKQKLS